MPRNKYIARAVSLMLCLALVVCSAPESASGLKAGEAVTSDGTAEPERQSAFVPGYIDLGTEIPALKSGSSASFFNTESSLPDSFDLRDYNGKNYVTPVRNQNPYGTCWSFSAVASIESNLLMQGYSGYEDLSELQLVYFNGNRNAAVAGDTGDVVSFYLSGHTNPDSKNSILNIGGNDIFASSALTGWLGLIPESELPYSEAASVVTDGVADEYARGKNVVQLDYIYEVNLKTDPDEAKKLLMQSGAASTAYYYSLANEPNEGSYYQTDMTSTNHAVTMVGWDDNYPRENFGSKMPNGNGAWLVKNSWGESYGHDGYFYVSYEDTSMRSAYFYGGTPIDLGHDHLYQYDGGLYHEGKYTARGDSVFGANMFTAKGNEVLEAVMVKVPYPGTELTISIYSECGESQPVSGLFGGKTSFECPYAGSYTIDLAEEVYLLEGEVFSVVVEYSNPNGTTGMNYDAVFTSFGFTSTPKAYAGQSFYSNDGTVFADMSAEYGNVCIKALTVDGDGALMMGDVSSDGVIDLADAILLSRHLSGSGELDRKQLKAANVDRTDMMVTMGDAEYMLRVIAGLR